MIIIYKCEWTGRYIAYDNNYADEWTPHGQGLTKKEAIEDLQDTMQDFFNSSSLMSAWMREIEIGDRHDQ